MFHRRVAGDVVNSFLDLLSGCLIVFGAGVSPCAGKLRNSVKKSFLRFFRVQMASKFIQSDKFFVVDDPHAIFLSWVLCWLISSSSSVLSSGFRRSMTFSTSATETGSSALSPSYPTEPLNCSTKQERSRAGNVKAFPARIESYVYSSLYTCSSNTSGLQHLQMDHASIRP